VTAPSLAIPLATYRFQLCGHLTFDAARELVDYLGELGIGAAYFSPFFRARAGSTHGYDVVDHGAYNPELGSEEQFKELARSLRDSGLGLVVDIVPNHMGIDDPHNGWWQDVLENGPASQYARFFDIDWNPPKEGLRNKVLLPVLGDQFGRVLEDQQLRLSYEDARFVISYYERRFPTDPATWVRILRRADEDVSARFEADVPERMELESIITSLEHLPPRSATEPEAIQERYREKEVTAGRLARLWESSGEVRQAIERTVAEFNGQKGDLASFDQLEGLLTDQPYRLCFWRVATDEINYRRFFDIDELAAIRVEDAEVFEGVHAAVLRLVGEGLVTGLRIDHADGLRDPEQYLVNLAEATGRALGDEASGTPRLRLYTVVEKILAHDETLPEAWLTHGTTGYDFLNLVNGVFVDRRGGYALRDAYCRFIGNWKTWSDVLHEGKRTILSSSLSAELYTLSHQLDRISEQHRWSRDFTRLSLFRALREVVACFPVYRTYIRPCRDEVRDEDRRRILSAVRVAKRRNPTMSASFFDFIGSVLLLEDPEGLSDEDKAVRRNFVLKFQQVTGPVTAKGLEDTAFYRYYPLASLNEVGGDPATPGTSVEHFHRRVQEQEAAWPHTMVASGTHDTKRGEDMRARLNVLSEIPEEWESRLSRWQAMNAEARVELDGEAVPDGNVEHLIYQTLVGTWPLESGSEEDRNRYIERVVKYLDKALREAKVHTSWTSPYEEYDQAIAGYIRTILADAKLPFVRDLDEFSRSIADAGFTNGLAQLLVKLCVPGVPDFYQGVEFWDFNLVDPDNRRPVDFAARRAGLTDVTAKFKRPQKLAAELLTGWPDKRIKLFVTWRMLQLRKLRRELASGAYLPLEVDGPRKTHVLALARVDGRSWSVCVVPRLTAEAWRQRGESGNGGPSNEPHWPIASWWRETVIRLPEGAPAGFEHAFSAARLAVEPHAEGGTQLDAGAVFETFPIALLFGESKY